MNHEDVAQVCHEANRVVQKLNGEEVSPPWDDAPEEMRQSAIDGVQNAMYGTTPEESHQNWVRFKENRGWTYGQKKSEEDKTHPCLVAYNQLPPEQRIKDRLFTNIVSAFVREGIL